MKQRKQRKLGGPDGGEERWPPDICEQLRQHSFCAIRLRDDEAELLRRLDAAARGMFSSREALDMKPLQVPATRDPDCPATATKAHAFHEEVAFIGLKRLKHRAIFRVRRHGKRSRCRALRATCGSCMHANARVIACAFVP